MQSRTLTARPRRWRVTTKSERITHKKDLEIDSAVAHKQKRGRRQAWRETRDLLRQMSVADLIESDLEP